MKRKLTIKTTLVLILVLVSGTSALWLAYSPRAGEPNRYTVASSSTPFGLYAPGTLDELPAAAANELIAALGLTTLADYQDYTLGLVEELGVTWVRIDFLYDGKQFLVPEDYLAKLEANGVEVVGCPRSFVPLDPATLATYQERLGQLVTDLPTIRVWQIDNEPNIGVDSPDRYLEVFFAGREAVAEACPDCRIALAGVPVLDPGRQASLEYYDTLLAKIAARYRGDDPPFDIFDIHYYGMAGSSADLLNAYNDYEELLRKYGLAGEVRLWMTECATYAGQPLEPPGLPAQSEEQQAAELIERFVVLLGAGAERVAWSRFYENHNYTGVISGYYDYSGLVYNGLGAESSRGIVAGKKKLGFDAYRRLISETSGYAGVSRVASGQYRFDFSDGREPAYVVWAEGDTPVAEELEGSVLYTDLQGNVYESTSLELGQAPVFVKKL